MRALAYLEWRFFRHQVGAIGRSPRRLAIWIPYAISLGFLFISRLRSGHSGIFETMQLDGPRLTAIGGLYLGGLGITVALAAAGRAGGFRSTAEALLFSNSGIRPLEIMLWLQWRKICASALRWSTLLLYYFLIFFPRHASPLVAVTAFTNALLAVLLAMSLELPIFLLSRGRFNFAFRALGWSLAAAGFAYAAVGFAGRRTWAPFVAFVRVDPGYTLRSVQHGGHTALALFGTTLVVMAVAVAMLAHDSLPELYAISNRSLAGERRRDAAAGRTRYASVVSTSAARIPRGALALVWKEWVGFRRARGALALFLAGSAFWAICGAGFALASLALQDETLLLTLLGASGLILLFFAAQGAEAGLAGDLGKPIFWLGDDPLRLRLAAATLGPGLRGGLALALGPLCAGLVLHNATIVLVALPLSASAFWSLQALGIGLHAVFPNPVDARGPMALLRTFGIVAYVFPALICGAAAFAFAGVALACLTTCVVFILEGAAVIEFASYRFSERGAEVALVSSAG
ncbi:MAG: hypothetical protein IAI49_03995 [Candidatus Eremiobacteraeota bacterium]|nr:hypothetical protein [Candidatus Eremiobacteraeota bacterium]